MTVACAGGTAFAADRYWVAGSSYWDIPAAWSTTPGGSGGAGMPANGDNAYIISSGSILVIRDNVTPSYVPPGPALVRLTGTGAGFVRLNQSTTAGTMAASTLDVGYAGTAEYDHAGGTVVVGNLNVGAGGAGTGIYTIRDLAQSLTADVLTLGNNGNTFGTFNQFSGTVSTLGMTLGFNSAGAHGVYNFMDGFFVNTDLQIADVGASTFSQTGGAGQSLQVTIGTAGAGTMNISGGAFASGESMQVGAVGTGPGSLNISGTGSYGSIGSLLVGALGRITQSGGTFTASGSMTVNGGRFDYNAGTFRPASGTTINITGGGTVALNTGFYILPDNTGYAITNGQLQLTGNNTFGGNGAASLLVSGSSASVVNTSGSTGVGLGTGGVGTATFA
ncbi:MAG TPA: hypothetical protein VH518_07975, partial [Tepidisphaeraceae bacterium]